MLAFWIWKSGVAEAKEPLNCIKILVKSTTHLESHSKVLSRRNPTFYYVKSIVSWHERFPLFACVLSSAVTCFFTVRTWNMGGINHSIKPVHRILWWVWTCRSGACAIPHGGTWWASNHIFTCVCLLTEFATLDSLNVPLTDCMMVMPFNHQDVYYIWI